MIIEDTFLSTIDAGATWTPAPDWVTTGTSRQRVADMASRGEWAELIAADPPTYRTWREQGTAWLGYDDPIIQSNPEPSDNIDVAAVYLSGTVEERAQSKRESFRDQIERNRIDADVLQIDLRADPGRSVLMDEANNQAKTKINQLAGTVDEDLDSFDPSFDPLQIGSIATASSLYMQTERTLSTDPTLDAQQISDLNNLKSQYAVIASGTDDAAPVPVPTDNVRLKLGVVAEAFGTLQCRRIWDEVNQWWNHEFELRVNRELSVDDYWLALYRFDGVYLSTPLLTHVGGNVYRADAAAVNIQQPTLQELQYSLAHQHVSNLMFDRIVIGADQTERIDPIRWGGNAS